MLPGADARRIMKVLGRLTSRIELTSGNPFRYRRIVLRLAIAVIVAGACFAVAQPQTRSGIVYVSISSVALGGVSLLGRRKHLVLVLRRAVPCGVGAYGGLLYSLDGYMSPGPVSIDAQSLVTPMILGVFAGACVAELIYRPICWARGNLREAAESLEEDRQRRTNDP